MVFLKWIFALPFIVGAVLFALEHPQNVPITFNPFTDPIELPLYFVSLMFLGGGFILGAFMAWVGMSKTRQERRAYKKEVKILTKENEKLTKEKADALSAISTDSKQEVIQGN